MAAAAIAKAKAEAPARRLWRRFPQCLLDEQMRDQLAFPPEPSPRRPANRRRETQQTIGKDAKEAKEEPARPGRGGILRKTDMLKQSPAKHSPANKQERVTTKEAREDMKATKGDDVRQG